MPRTPAFPHRGSVHLVRFDPSVGHEIRKTRPAVIVSNNHMNELSDTVLLMPITGGRYSYYHSIRLRPREGGMLKSSSIITEQLKSVDKRRLGKRLGIVRPDTMTKIEQSIRDHCALPGTRLLP